jgi:hypothetical protein
MVALNSGQGGSNRGSVMIHTLTTLPPVSISASPCQNPWPLGLPQLGYRGAA